MTRNILDRMKTSEVVERVEEKINQGAKVKRKEWTKKRGGSSCVQSRPSRFPQKLSLEPRERAKG